MNISTISTISRILIAIAFIFQIVTMVSQKTRLINPYAFFLYAIAAYMMSYVYYKEDNKMTQRTYFKIFNSTLIVVIAILALPQVKFLGL